MIDPLLYQRMVEQSRDYALFILDPSGRIMSWNLGAERLKGYAADEIIGRHFSTFYTREAVESGWPAHELQVATVEGRFECLPIFGSAHAAIDVPSGLATQPIAPRSQRYPACRQYWR